MVTTDDFTFVQCPRTGSRSVRDALLKLVPSAVVSRRSHTPWCDVPRDKPIYAITRYPMEMVLTWWMVVGRTSPDAFEAFVRRYPDGPIRRGMGSGLNIYEGIVDRYFIFEGGLHNAVAEMTDEVRLAVVADVQFTKAEKAHPPDWDICRSWHNCGRRPSLSAPPPPCTLGRVSRA